MRILFLGDVVGITGCLKIQNNLLDQIKKKKIDFVIVNAENAAEEGVGLTKEICEDFFKSGVNQKGIIMDLQQKKDLMAEFDAILSTPGFAEAYDMTEDGNHGNRGDYERKEKFAEQYGAENIKSIIESV